MKKKCKKHCCEVTYLPLTLAFALTLHKFQGWETNWKNDSPVFYLLVDIGSTLDEIRAPGTCYAALSRPHTIGDITASPNKNSALYLIGNDVCFNRIKNIGLTKNGEQTSFIKSRELWVNFLNEQKEKTDEWITKNKDNWMKIYNEDIKDKSMTRNQLETSIFQRITRLKANYI